MQPPPPPKQFEIPKELLQETEVEQEQTPSPMISTTNMIAKFIAYTIPKSRKKYIIPILEKLRDVNYTFKDSRYGKHLPEIDFEILIFLKSPN
ncbi:uncharacterized protein TNCV_2430311 [Trichonephila clavipes]|nr:uncharacterized protein TNCV_2430311 [Trichonephila clavipes]